MSQPAIRIENLSKLYRLGETHDRTLSDRLGRAFGWATGQRRAQAPRVIEDFWALRDINLELKEGEALGIVGGNGAGKSTLLKILSRITTPTTGRALVRGRLASLLEVGTGFHPELTGRENVFLNGTILGMRKAEVARKFDEIVAFAGVEKFFDTPVKRYSSGMYVRLAFAVAAHLEPDVLIVDEVLAVGDAGFQQVAEMLDVITLWPVAHRNVGGQRPIAFRRHSGVGNHERVCRRQAADIGKTGGVGFLVAVEQQEIRDGQVVQRVGNIGMLAHAVQRIAEHQRFAHLRVEKRFHAEMIAGTEQLPLRSIPDRKSEIADQAVDAVLAPGVVGVQDQFVVERAVEGGAASCPQSFFQFSLAIDARIGSNPDVSVEAGGLLFAFGLEGGAQQGMAEADVTLVPDALCIRAAKRQEVSESL